MSPRGLASAWLPEDPGKARWFALHDSLDHNPSLPNEESENEKREMALLDVLFICIGLFLCFDVNTELI
jgi:hypothetical protein